MRFKIIIISFGLLLILTACSQKEWDGQEEFATQKEEDKKTVVITFEPDGSVPPGEKLPELLMHEDRGAYCAYIQGFYLSPSGENYVYVRPVEWITSEDEERIAELGLTEEDMISGYYILDEGQDMTALQITEETEYHFIDWYHDFTDLIQMRGNNSVTWSITKEEEVFIRYLEIYEDGAAGYPLFFEMDGEKVTCIWEKWLA